MASRSSSCLRSIIIRTTIIPTKIKSRIARTQSPTFFTMMWKTLGILSSVPYLHKQTVVAAFSSTSMQIRAARLRHLPLVQRGRISPTSCTPQFLSGHQQLSQLYSTKSEGSQSSEGVVNGAIIDHNGHELKGLPQENHENTSRTLTPAPVRKPLDPSQLRWKCDPTQFKFETTDDLIHEEKDNLNGKIHLLGQERAESAIEFGIGMQRDGYNLFVLGPSGTGKRTVVQKYLEQHVAQSSTLGDHPTLYDWCYVHNFEHPDKPKVVKLPPGTGQIWSQDMQTFIEDLRVAIPAALDSQDHREKIEKAEKKVVAEYDEQIDELSKEAELRGLRLIRRPESLVLLVPDNIDKQDPQSKADLEKAVEDLQPKIRNFMKKLPQVLKLVRETIKQIDQEATQSTIEVLIAPLKEKYAQNEKDGVLEHLKACETEIIDNAHEFLQGAASVAASIGMGNGADGSSTSSDMVAPMMEALISKRQEKYFNRFLINVLVDHNDTVGAPVIVEDNPNYYKLIGRVEHESSLGSFTTDYSQIKAGSLHRANGGYLVLRARDVLMQPFAWEGLKRALRSGHVQMDSLGNELSLISTVSLQPEPIPLDVKVVLLGDPRLYYLLQAYDEEFNELFKVAADFNVETDRTEESCQLYASMLATLTKTEKTRPMDPPAVALMLEQGARTCSDQDKLSTHMRSTADLVRESDYWAQQDQSSTMIRATHVTKAIEQQIYRSDRIRELVHEQIQRGVLLVDVQGEQIGQVNGLSIMGISSGAGSFGRPSRITATARLGRGKVVDVEREVELGGSIHSKGVMILSSLLASRYAKDFPLSLSASLVFEQSYGMVEGDSASVAELCALLSVLANVPIQQGLAITGSLNQKGQAQAIGGVNEKIEGFFDICRASAATATTSPPSMTEKRTTTTDTTPPPPSPPPQGVLIPSSNAKHLMLRQDVVEAVEQGLFAIYTYDTVDDALELLTGIQAGVREDDTNSGGGGGGGGGGDGAYPENTINGRVDRRLRDMANLMVSFEKSCSTKENDNNNQEDGSDMKRLVLDNLKP